MFMLKKTNEKKLGKRNDAHTQMGGSIGRGEGKSRQMATTTR